MAIAQDASTPVNVTQTANTTTTLVTASFTPPANALVVAMCGHVYSGVGTAGNTLAVSDSLAGSWASSTHIQSTNGVHAGVFTRLIGSSAAMTVTMTTDAVTKGKQLTVVVLTGTAQSAWVGANIKTAAGTTANTMEQSVTTTTVGSWELISVSYDTNAAITADANTTQYSQLTDSSDGGRIASGHMTTPTVSPGAITVGFTGGGSGIQQAFVAYEILPPAAAASIPNVIMAPPIAF